jgi:SMC interacting uncharacterized protein involved in chromosome segregation
MIDLVKANDFTTAPNDPQSRQPAMTSEAMNKLKERLQSLIEDRKRAEASDDQAAMDECNEEMAAINAQIKSDTNIHGRVRNLNQKTDGFRATILANIKRAREKLEKAVPSMLKLASHFEINVSSSGSDIVYAPETPIKWSADHSVDKK